MASTKSPTKSRRKQSNSGLFGRKGLIVSRAKDFPKASLVTAAIVAVIGIAVLVFAYASSSTVVDETFSSASSNFTTVVGGTWAFTNGHYTLTNPAQDSSPDAGNANYAIHKYTHSGDFTESVDFDTTPSSAVWNDASVIFNWQDKSNYMFASFNESNNGTTNGIFKVAGGVSTQLGNFSKTFNPGVRRTTVIKRTGNTYTVSVDGTVVGSVSNVTDNGGRFGFGSRNDSVYFDNFIVTIPVSATPTPSTTPTPTPRITTGQPNASNTGVPAGTKLTVYYGDLTLRQAGQVVDGLDIRGSVKIEAANVTLKNSIIHGSPHHTLLQSIGAGDIIEDTELAEAYPEVSVNGLIGYGFTAQRLNIHGTVDTAMIYGSNTTIRDSYLWDNRQYAHDPAQNNGPSHDDGIQVQAGNNNLIFHNNIVGGHNTAIMVTQDAGYTTNLTISSNWAGRGNCSINVSESGRGGVKGISFINNRFYRNAGISYCQILVHSATNKLTKFSGNVHDDDNKSITPVVVSP